MKTIVTHLSPDLDAITSSWLIKRFMPGWEDASLKFVFAGTTLDNKDPDEDLNIIHVDTGLGKFDHHQVEDRSLCAAKLVFNHLVEEKHLKGDYEEAIRRIIEYVVIDDNFQDVFFHDPDSDIYDFQLHRIIDAIKLTKEDDVERCDFIFQILDALVYLFKNKIKGEEEIKKGYVFTTKLGKTLAVETKNRDVVKLSLKMGFKVVVRRDPDGGSMSIKTLPLKELDLTPLHKLIVEKDKKGTWFLHSSKNMLLNGSTKNPNMIPTSLNLKQVIDLLKQI